MPQKYIVYLNNMKRKTWIHFFLHGYPFVSQSCEYSEEASIYIGIFIPGEYPGIYTDTLCIHM